MTATTLDVATLEQVAQGPAEQCGTWSRVDGAITCRDRAGFEQCPEAADYVVRSHCGTGGHVVRTPVCLEHVDGVVERVEAGARCARHRTRVALVSVTPLGG